ncbi:MAG: hypothetical protein HZA93_21230 [Verrucomicrobia bacterium]|nr:hypothetical protein [Verrucomicrobiota bacterium]
MNTLAATILQALDAQGILSLRFRILKLTGGLRHSTPVADLETGRHCRNSLNGFSITELFNAYALAPRKGEYVLNVAEGMLAFLPESVRTVAKPVEVRARALKFSRSKAKATRRHTRPLHAAARLAA